MFDVGILDPGFFVSSFFWAKTGRKGLGKSEEWITVYALLAAPLGSAWPFSRVLSVRRLDCVDVENL